MPLARVNGKLLHFVHIPKTGGSSVTSYLRTIGKVALYSRNPVDWARTTPQHMDIQTAKTLLPADFVDVRFAIMRDPLERILSEFQYRYTRLAHRAPHLHPVEADEPVTVELDWNKTFHGTFEEWVDLVFTLYERDHSACDNHIRPQSDFVDPDVKLFLFENGLGPVIEWIDKFTGAKGQATRLDRNESIVLPVNVRPGVRRRIESFYARDYDLIARQSYVC